MACHHIDGAIYAAPGPYLDDIRLIVPEVSKQCQLDPRSGPDLSTMWETAPCRCFVYEKANEDEEKISQEAEKEMP